jgi:hypothetical protein
MVTVGYQLPPDRIPEELKEREFGPRKRRPLSESFFVGEWAKPFFGDYDYGY